MDTIANHAALQEAIRQATVAEDAAWRAYADATPEDGPARMLDYVRASTRRNTLNEAGLIITLGPVEEETHDIQPE